MKNYLMISAITTVLMLSFTSVFAQVKIGAIYDLTGNLDVYGDQQLKGLTLAVDHINANGGVLGQDVEVVSYDTESELSNYTEHAQEAVAEELSAVFAGLTSSSREKMRPIFRRAKVPYFYSTLYEGGVCDKQTFVTGPSASQQLEPLIKWALKEYGPKIYVMAPDYNYGKISAFWVDEYASQNGGEVVGEDILPLSQEDYSTTINKIRRAKPDFVVALPVGPNQLKFLDQFSEAGLKKDIGMVSTNYGSGNQQLDVSTKTGEGVVASLAYFMKADNPENRKFLALWREKYGEPKAISPEAVTVWNAVHLWAEAAKKAGSIDNKKVIAALESGLRFKGPNGTVIMQPGSHHVSHTIYLGRGDANYNFDIVEKFENSMPSYEQSVCDLVNKPYQILLSFPGKSKNNKKEEVIYDGSF